MKAKHKAHTTNGTECGGEVLVFVDKRYKFGSCSRLGGLRTNRSLLTPCP